MPPVLVVLGPTATGKSDLAISLAERFDGEIVNADALQVYRGLEVGTAKPPPSDRVRIRHHLVDILEPDETFSAGQFARLARVAIAGIHRASRLPIVVGGSGLYLESLLVGLSPIPAIPAKTRSQLRGRLEREGLAALRQELRQVDPDTEQRLAAGDTQRILRALEVWTATSRTLSSWQDEKADDEPIESIKIGLTLPRSLLYDRIAERAEAMMDRGWLEEVRQLLASGFTGSEPAFQAIGYRQLVEHLKGQTSLSRVLSSIIVATRQYAKRQMTWFRRDADLEWYSAEDAEMLVREVAGDLSSRLKVQEV
jgi:tRNA dimethylallyltransferase